jgi:hypothetical protein
MKLIKELNEDLQFIVEESSDNGKKSLFIEGVFLQADLKNRNGRMYPKEIMAKEVNRYVKEQVNTKRAYGELGHPEGPNINLDRVSHMIVSLREDGNNWIGRAKILDTPMGNIASSLIKEGAGLGVSSRGLGTLKEVNGINEVQDDFMLATAADIVADPSAPDAYIQGIMEGKEWVFVKGVWQDREIEETKNLIKKTSSRNLSEAKVKAFEAFLDKISRI